MGRNKEEEKTSLSESSGKDWGTKVIEVEGAEGYMTSAVLGGPRRMGLGEIRHMWHRMGVRRKQTLWHSVDIVLRGVGSCSTRSWGDLGPDSLGGDGILRDFKNLATMTTWGGH